MRVIIVDDHKIIRDGLRVLLERDSGLRVVGEAANGHDGVALALKLRPDVVVIDMAMPELNGIEAARQMRAGGFGGGIAMISSHSERHIVSSARAAGVDAYVRKEDAFEEVRAAIGAAARREVFLSPGLAELDKEGRLVPISTLLTPREREVLQLLAEGHSVKEIAFRFELSAKTVETHRANLMTKLGVDNLADLTRLAVREGLAKM